MVEGDHPHHASFLSWTSVIPMRQSSAMDVKTTRLQILLIVSLLRYRAALFSGCSGSAAAAASLSIQPRCKGETAGLKITACSTSGFRVPLHPLLHPG